MRSSAQFHFMPDKFHLMPDKFHLMPERTLAHGWTKIAPIDCGISWPRRRFYLVVAMGATVEVLPFVFSPFRQRPCFGWALPCLDGADMAASATVACAVVVGSNTTPIAARFACLNERSFSIIEAAI
jgi:hypothetical protein